MTLLQMSLAGGLLIAVICVLRLLLQHRLHRSVLLSLWTLAILRLLVPVFVSSELSVFNLPVFSRETPTAVVSEAAETAGTVETAEAVEAVGAAEDAAPVPPILTAAEPPAPKASLSTGEILGLIWLGGVLLFGCAFLISHLRSLRTFRFSVPLPENIQVPDGLRVRMLDDLKAPLTYGLFRPTVLLPTELPGQAQVTHILLHEQEHIRHLDLWMKLLLLLTACIHWFNPLVWLMVYLASEDMEMRCDAAVVARLGQEHRLDYARTLVAAEQSRLNSILQTGFSFSSTANRLKAMKKSRTHPLISIGLGVVLCALLTLGFLTMGTSAAETPQEPAAPPAVSSEVPATEPSEIPEPEHTVPATDEIPTESIKVSSEPPEVTETTEEETPAAGSETSASPLSSVVVDTLPLSLTVGEVSRPSVYAPCPLTIYSDNPDIVHAYTVIDFSYPDGASNGSANRGVYTSCTATGVSVGTAGLWCTDGTSTRYLGSVSVTAAGDIQSIDYAEVYNGGLSPTPEIDPGNGPAGNLSGLIGGYLP